MGKMSRSDCFAAFGTTPRNKQWSWSAKSEDGSVVVATFWQDTFVGPVYRAWPGADRDAWKKSRGYRDLIEHLAWARDHLHGLVHPIIVIAADPGAGPRRIADCNPRHDIRMRLTHLDESTGDFTAVLEPAHQQ